MVTQGGSRLAFLGFEFTDARESTGRVRIPAGALVSLGKVQGGGSVIGAETKRLLKRNDGLHRPSTLQKQLSQKRMCRGEPGILSYGRSNQRFRLGGSSPNAVAGGCEEVGSAKIIRPVPPVLLGQANGVLEAPGVQIHSRQRVKGEREVGLAPQAGAQLDGGLVIARQLLERYALAQPQEQGIRMDGQRVRKDFERCLRRVVPQENLAQLEMGGFAARLEGEGCLGMLYGAFRISQSVPSLGRQQAALRRGRRIFEGLQSAEPLTFRDKLLGSEQGIVRGEKQHGDRGR